MRLMVIVGGAEGIGRMAEVRIDVSLTETPQFRRLVTFIHDVDQHARDTGDYELTEIVCELHGDLMGMSGDDGD